MSDTVKTADPRVNFFIVGAMKSGTSSLRDMLRQHPKVDLWRGEIHYFDKDNLFEQGLDWYHEHFEFNQPGRLQGDKSPSYSLAPWVPARMAAYNPDARLIWILRDPVKRLISNYHHALKRNPDALSIQDALSRAEELASVNSPGAYLYRSQYERHLALFDGYFKPEQHYITIFEELLADPDTETRKLLKWLGLSDDIELELPHSNKGKKRIKSKNPVEQILQDELRRRLAPTVTAVETRLQRSIPSWHVPAPKAGETT